MGGIGSGRPTKKEGKLPEKNISAMTPARKRTIVANLFFKGFQQSEIVEKTGLSRTEVASAVQAVKSKLKPTSIPELEYYRNKSRKLIGLGLSTAFEILDDDKNKKYPNLRLRALQVIREYAKLSADIDGITGEKVTAGPDKKAADLMGELKKMATDSGKKVTIKETLDAVADPGADRPDTEEDSNSQESGTDSRVSAVRDAE